MDKQKNKPGQPRATWPQLVLVGLAVIFVVGSLYFQSQSEGETSVQVVTATPEWSGSSLDDADLGEPVMTPVVRPAFDGTLTVVEVGRFQEQYLMNLDWNPATQELFTFTSLTQIAYDVSSLNQDGEEIRLDQSGWGNVISPDGVLTAQFGNDSIWIQDTATGSQVAVLVGHRSTVQALDFNANGSLLVSGGDDGRVLVWDMNSFEQVVELSGHENAITDVAFSPDGDYIASVDRNRTVNLWRIGAFMRDDIGMDDLLAASHEDDNWMYTLAFSPDGQYLVAGTDESLRWWQVDDGLFPVDQHPAHLDTITDLSFSPDGRLLASASEDNTVRIWDVATRQELNELPQHLSDVEFVQFSPDGRWLVSADDEDNIYLWTVSVIAGE